MAGYDIEVISADEGFTDAGKIWRPFEAGQQRLYFSQAYDWLRIWWETFRLRADQQFGYDKKLLILLLYRQGELAAIAPFVKLRRKKYGLPFSFIEFLGQQWGCTFMDIIGDSHGPESWRQLMAWLYANVSFDVLCLAYLPEGSPTLAQAKSESVFPLSACPFIDLTQYSAYEHFAAANYSAHHRHNLRTRANRLGRDGVVCEFTVEKPSPAVIDDIMRLSESKLVDGKTSIYLDADKRNFMQRVLGELAADVVLARLDGQAAAYRLNTYFRGWKICLDASYDREYRFYGIGSLSLDHSIRSSFARQLAVHCEGTGTDDYKLDFTRQAISINKVIQAGNTLFSPLVLRRLTASEKRNQDVAIARGAHR